MASSHIFTTKAEALKTLLEKQEQTYKAEESALKVCTETMLFLLSLQVAKRDTVVLLFECYLSWQHKIL